MNNIHFIFSECFFFLITITSFCLVRAMEYAKFALIIQRIRTEEMLVIFDFFFKFLGMNFSAVSYKSPQEFCSGHQEHLNSFFSVVFFCHAHII